MKKNRNLLIAAILLVIIGLLSQACAPGELDRRPVSGQEQPGAGSSGGGQTASGEAPSAGEMGANIELPPNQPVCPTPTPTVGVGTAGGGESGVGEAVAGPATTETIGGQTTVGTLVPDILDKVNRAPRRGSSDQTSGETGVGPEPGIETFELPTPTPTPCP